MSVKRFNKMIASLGFYVIDHHGAKVMYTDEDRPITKAQLKERFHQWQKNNNIKTNEEFSITIQLPIFKAPIQKGG